MGRRGLMSESASTMGEVRKQIEHWRKTRPHRCKMPEHLWQSAIGLAQTQGIYAVSQGLHISYDRLKAHVDAAGKGRKIKGIQRLREAEFVELLPAMTVSSPSDAMVLELVGAGGNRLIVRVPGAAGGNVVAMIRELYGRGP
jgi:hypothetical protein